MMNVLVNGVVIVTVKDNVIELYKYEPHLVIQTENYNHVIPVSLFQSVLDNKLKITDIYDYEEIIKKIIKDWLIYTEKKEIE